MRGITYFILAYLTLGLQTGIEPFIQVHGAGPNLVLLTVVFIAINAPREPALLGCLALGLLQDLTTKGTLGLYGLSYGVVAMFVVSTQQTVYREHPLTHFTVTLVGGLLTAAILLLHEWVHPAAPPVTTDTGAFIPAMRQPPALLFTGALYTAVLAPFVLGVLQRMKRVFQFTPARRRPNWA